MRGTTIGRIVLLVGALALSGCSYNRLVGLRENIDAAWAQVENQLQRRNDLIPNLVEVTKGYAAHEKEIFTAVAEARAKLIGAGTRDEKIAAAENLQGALSVGFKKAFALERRTILPAEIRQMTSGAGRSIGCFATGCLFFIENAVPDGPALRLP